MIGTMAWALSFQAAYEAERAIIENARAAMSPEQFAEWQAERTRERRHQELCAAIREAGERSRPRGFGVFW